MKRIITAFTTLALGLQLVSPVYAATLVRRPSKLIQESSEDNYLQNTRLVQEKNEQALLSSTLQAEAARRTSAASKEPDIEPFSYLLSALGDAARMEAAYVLAAQFLSPGDPAHGAINNVYGAPTWIVPRENALAILTLIETAWITGDTSYLDSAALAADYLIRVQDPTDGGWYDQYDHATPVVLSKSPTQTAEAMMALYQLGYTSERYEAMKKGAQFLMACQDPANKTGQDDGLLGGGKDANGQFHTWRWASDNSFAYLAFKAAQAWAAVSGDNAFASQSYDSAARVLDGINRYLYISDTSDDDYGVWRRAIDGSGTEMEPYFHEWINYAPQMLDLPAVGVGSQRVGQWIHDKFQREDGAVVWNDTWHTTRKSPGFSFQAVLVWRDLGQDAYADAAISWAEQSGLWQTTPDQNGITGGWIDWVEPADRAPFWQRFIDTSFYSTAAMAGGYDFSIGDATSSDLLLMRLQGNSQWRVDLNLLFGTDINAMGRISDEDAAVLVQLVHDPAYRYETFFGALTQAAGLYRAIQSSSSYRADFDLLFGTHLPTDGAPGAADRLVLFGVAGDPSYRQTDFLHVLTKTAALYRSLQASTSYRSDFDLLFGTKITSSGAPSVTDRTILFNTAGDPFFIQANFLPVLTRTASLYRTLRASVTYRNDFNLLFSTVIAPAGALAVNDRAILFGVAGDPGYNQASFLPVLVRTASLYRAIRASASYRNDFNLLYAAVIKASGSPTMEDRTTLFGVAGTAGYVQSTYLTVLTKTAGLYRSLQTSAVYRADFNLMYGAMLPASGAPNAADRGRLFGVAGTPGFDLSKYLPVLRKTSSLYTKLQAKTVKRLSYNQRYNAALPASGSPRTADLATIFGIAGSPTYNEAKFLASL